MPKKLTTVKDPDQFFDQEWMHPYEVLADGKVWRFEKSEYGSADYFSNEARKWANKRGKVIRKKVVDKGTDDEYLVLWMKDPTEDQKKRTAALRVFYGIEEDVTLDDVEQE